MIDNLDVIYNSGTYSSNFITGSWAPASDDTSLWYCNKVGTQAVIKLTSSGTVGVSYENVTDLKGLCATEDGGCWFIDNDVLYNLILSMIFKSSKLSGISQSLLINDSLIISFV